MEFVVLGQLLVLILVANGTPVLMAWASTDGLALPVDRGKRFSDGRPVLGPTKTYRGILLSILFTVGAAVALGLPAAVGLKVAVFAMLGDLTSSFVKRRLGKPSSSMALGLDQIPESLFPLLAVQHQFELDLVEVLGMTALFFILELGLSRVLYSLNIRKQPY